MPCVHLSAHLFTVLVCNLLAFVRLILVYSSLLRFLLAIISSFILLILYASIYEMYTDICIYTCTFISLSLFLLCSDYFIFSYLLVCFRSFSRFGMCLVQKVQKLTAKTAAAAAAAVTATPQPIVAAAAVAKSTQLMKWMANVMLCWIQQHLICMCRNWRISLRKIQRIRLIVEQTSGPNQNKPHKLNRIINNNIINICQTA